MRLRIGIAQVDCTLGDLGANFERHRRMIRQARDAGVEVLVFPELSLTGYALGERTVDVALPRNGGWLAELAALAPEMSVTVGFVEEGSGARCYNAAALLDGGTVRHVHRKLNLPTYGNLDEGKRYAAGQRLDGCALKHPWQAALLVCADLWNPALVHLAMLQGATCLLAPVASAVDAVGGEFSNPDGWDLALRFYAMMYGTPIAMANRVGREGAARYWGGSRILDAEGRVLAQADDREALIHAEIDYEQVRRARFRLPTLRDANTPLVQRELTRALGTLQ